MADVSDSEESSDAVESPPGEPGRFLVRSFFIRVNRTGSFSLTFLGPLGGGGLTPDTSMISPARLRGLGGGGWRRGSVGLSDDVDAAGRTGRRVGGGVIGRAGRRVGGDGVGDGGR